MQRPKHLTWNRLIERAMYCARTRYSVELNEVWFADLNKDGFFPWRPRRDKNQGQSPVYLFDRRFYRRVLQLARFKKLGIVDRDALMVQLFVRGYSQPVENKLKQALHKEYVKCTRALLHSIRSGYADNWRPVPDSHKASLIRQVGSLNSRLGAADLALSAEMIIKALRIAKQKPLKTDAAAWNEGQFRELIDADFETAATSFAEELAGLLMLNDGPVNASSEGTIDWLIFHSDDQSYQVARELFWLFAEVGASLTFATLHAKAGNSAKQGAIAAITNSMKDRPEWAALMLTLGLFFARRTFHKPMKMLAFQNEKVPPSRQRN